MSGSARIDFGEDLIDPDALCAPYGQTSTNNKRSLTPNYAGGPNVRNRTLEMPLILLGAIGASSNQRSAADLSHAGTGP